MQETTAGTSLPSHAGHSISPSLLRWGFWLIILAATAQLIQWGIWRPFTWIGVDYGKHWQAAHAILSGRNNYINSDGCPNLWLGFNYPQATAFAYLWLGWLSLETGEIVYKSINIILTMLTGLLAWRFFRPRTISPGPAFNFRSSFAGHWGAIVYLVIAFYFPLLSSIYVGNIDPVNAVLVMGLTVALISARERLAGLLWTSVTLIKMMPLMLFLPFLLWRRWRILQVFFGLLGVYFLLLVFAGRLKWEWFFVNVSMPRIPFYWREISISPYRFLMLALGFGETLKREPDFLRWMYVYTLCCTALWVGFTILLRRRRATLLEAVECTLLFIPLLSPLLEYHHFIWILPVLMLQLQRGLERGFTGGILIFLVAGWTLVMLGFQITFQLRPLIWLSFPPLVGYFFILGASIYDLLQKEYYLTPAYTNGRQALVASPS